MDGQLSWDTSGNVCTRSQAGNTHVGWILLNVHTTYTTQDCGQGMCKWRHRKNSRVTALLKMCLYGGSNDSRWKGCEWTAEREELWKKYMETVESNTKKGWWQMWRALSTFFKGAPPERHVVKKGSFEIRNLKQQEAAYLCSICTRKTWIDLPLVTAMLLYVIASLVVLQTTCALRAAVHGHSHVRYLSMVASSSISPAKSDTEPRDYRQMRPIPCTGTYQGEDGRSYTSLFLAFEVSN